MTRTVPPSPSAGSPARLTAARLRTGYTANDVCDILNWGRGKVGRFEANQWKRPEMSDIRDLVRIYGIDGDEKEQIEDLAIRARARPWWREYPEIFDSEFPGYENDATTIRVFMPLVLPGLLQIPAYTEALMRAGLRLPAYRRRALRIAPAQAGSSRSRRRLRTMFSAVITEASLLYRWGMREDRREQVEHLVELSKHRQRATARPAVRRRPLIGIVSMVTSSASRRRAKPRLRGDRLFEMEEVSKPETVQRVHRIVRACLRCRA